MQDNKEVCHIRRFYITPIDTMSDETNTTPEVVAEEVVAEVTPAVETTEEVAEEVVEEATPEVAA